MIWHQPLILTRDWGEEQVLLRTPLHCGKILRRRAGTMGGLQFHVKEESHYLLSGRLRVIWDAGAGLQSREVQAGACWTVPPFTPHREEALADSVVVEISDPTLNDRVRVEAWYHEPAHDTLPSMTIAEAVTQLRELAKQQREAAEMNDGFAQIVEMYGWPRPGFA